ncbi:hypothetical protein [Cellulomonas palmilytica]|uniref:hypothetical protein n=1 Tax=Cellulomonas palmilytica TaxID=2608402 RepID=UPI001F1BA4F3|nr:hypothetical protein [Cellulomonas palmilytica]UJP40650.1 hypothetical protein F1D97_03865 [Cellulomonas palmilytica]
MSTPAPLPPRSEYDAQVAAHAADVATLGNQPSAAVGEANRSLENLSWWDKLWEWFTDLVDDIQRKLEEFATKVNDFFVTIDGLDQGNPYALYAAGEGYLTAQRTFSGLDSSFNAWNLKALDAWEGPAGSTYAASVPVQAAAVARLASWCGSVGEILMDHSRNVVNEFLAMRAIMRDKLRSITAAVTSLAVVDPVKLADTIEKLIGLTIEIIAAVDEMKTAFEQWANASLRSIDSLKAAMADQTGTHNGEWPEFVRA